MRITVKLWGKGECVTHTLQSYSSGRLEGGICEQFVYLPDLAVYRKSSDMNELDDIRLGKWKENKWR